MDHAPITAQLAEDLVEVGARLHGLLAHMEAHQAAATSAPDAPSPADALATLLGSCLEPVVAEDPEAAVLASAILEAAVVAIDEDIFTVADDPPRRVARRRRGPRERRRDRRRRR